MKPKIILCLALILSGGLVGCSIPSSRATSNETVGDFRFHSPALSGDGRIQLTGSAIFDTNLGMCLSVTMKNKGQYKLVTEVGREFYEILPTVYRRDALSNPSGYKYAVKYGYTLVQPREDQSWREHIFQHSFYRYTLPSKTFTWKIPIHQFYDLKPGFYRADVAISVGIDLPEEKGFSTTVSTGPIEFTIP
ncbi:MAG TPA: hypothetical protein VHY30_10980 [Verrucomicrobiae bacterium]|jgi:hypothetical protein|nr:hypothetical protein [Verrucomicrobiae bacterium]